MCPKGYPKGSARRKQQQRPGLGEVQLPLCGEELVALMQESLSSFATEMGLRIASRLLEDEVTRRCGPRYEHRRQRELSRHGRQAGYVTLAGQKLSLTKPRVRRTDGRGETELETYTLLQRDEAMPEACLRRMVRGVSTRDYEHVVDLAREGFGVKKSSVSRGFGERGLDASRPILFVLDGAKALHAAIKRVFGKQAVIQRCQVHKARNVKAHLADKHHDQLATQLSTAYHETKYERALAGLKTTAAWLERINPAAAASLREGMEETLTVVKLGLPELLRRTLATTNPVESALSVAAKVTARVKRWRDGDMRLRWCTAGLLRAEEGFRRVKGHKQMPRLVEALDRIHQPIDEQKRTA